MNKDMREAGYCGCGESLGGNRNFCDDCLGLYDEHYEDYEDYEEDE